MDFISTVNIDAILSDPMLLVGACLLLLGPVIFIIALIQFIRANRKDEDDFLIPEEEIPEPASPPEAAPLQPIDEASAAQPHPEEPEPQPTPAPPVAPRRTVPAMQDLDMDKTVVMPPGQADIQAQLEIAISQIKMLNKKVYDLEGRLEDVSRQPAQATEQASAPASQNDFNQKLLKLAEHVIILEKEVTRLRTTESEKAEQPPVPPAKPPIMPL